MERELDRYNYKIEDMQKQFDTFSEALEEASLSIMEEDFSTYEDAKQLLLKMENKLETYIELVEEQNSIIKTRKKKSNNSRLVTKFHNNHKKLSNTRADFESLKNGFITKLSATGFRLIYSNDRIKEMEEKILLVSISVKKLQERIDELQEEMASLLDVPGRERRVEMLGKKLNEIEKQKNKIEYQQARLEKIIQFARRDLRREDYYWIGPGFPEKKFDTAFHETYIRVKLQLEDLEILLEE